MAISKYDGGARITTFRLPVKHFDEAKKGIEMYLKRYENPLANIPEKLRVQPVTPQDCFINSFPGPFEKIPPEIQTVQKNIPKAIDYGTFENDVPKRKVPKVNIPQDILEELKKLDPKIIIPDTGDLRPGVINPKVRLDVNTEIKKTVEKGNVRYSCGCLFDGLFRRSDNCKLDRKDH